MMKKKVKWYDINDQSNNFTFETNDTYFTWSDGSSNDNGNSYTRNSLGFYPNITSVS